MHHGGAVRVTTFDDVGVDDDDDDAHQWGSGVFIVVFIVVYSSDRSRLLHLLCGWRVTV